MHTRSKGTLDKKVLNEYPEDRKKKDIRKESVAIEPVEVLGTPQALLVSVSGNSSLSDKETLANSSIEVSDKSYLSKNETSNGYSNKGSNNSSIPTVQADSTLATKSE